jgi:hypothetical protein
MLSFVKSSIIISYKKRVPFGSKIPKNVTILFSELADRFSYMIVMRQPSLTRIRGPAKAFGQPLTVHGIFFVIYCDAGTILRMAAALK